MTVSVFWACLAASSFAISWSAIFCASCPAISSANLRRRIAAGFSVLSLYIWAWPTVRVCLIRPSSSSFAISLRAWRKLTPLFFAMSILL